MRRVYVIFMVIAALAVLAGCDVELPPDPKPRPASARRTVVVYMEARNSLAANAADDLAEMESATIPSDCRLLVYHSTRSGAPELLEIKNGAREVLKTYADEASAVDPAQMGAVLADVRSLAPAAGYGVVLWSHSSGWQQTSRRSRGFGLENSRQQMSVSDMAATLTAAGPFEFVVFDTCYMGCVEVAYELRRAARYMVASVCEVPTPGMPYDLTVEPLFDADTRRGLADAIDLTVDTYLADKTISCPSTLSLIDLKAMRALAAEVKAGFAAALPEGYEAQPFSLSTPFSSMFYDFGQWYDALGGNPALMAAAVLHERHTPMIWGRLPLEACSGLSVYLPQLTDGFDYTSYGYDTLGWYADVIAPNIQQTE